MIDHILVSKTLFDKIQFVDIYRGYKEYCGKYNSDHYPVIVDFVLNKIDVYYNLTIMYYNKLV